MSAAGLALALLGAGPISAARADDVPATAEGLIVHEWGTFTSFAGADGIDLEFTTEAGKDLPGFVWTRERASGIVPSGQSKAAQSLERMETPVIYFHTARAQDVSVRVDFPQGWLTEFYPHPRRFGPPVGVSPHGNGYLDWGRIHLLPPGSEEARGLTLAGLAADDDARKAEHYLYARDVDAALVRVCKADDEAPTEVEKFLFYRGIGEQKMPLLAEAKGGGRLALRSVPASGPMAFPLGRAFVLEVAPDRATARLVESGPIEAESVEVALPAWRPAAAVSGDLAGRMERALVEAGLFGDEARAMVRTWRSSWFETPGTRVLYLLPQALTDEILPLTIAPAPEKTVRVLLGRAEVLTPEAQRGVEEALRALIDPAGDHAVAHARIDALGRFQRPVLWYVGEHAQEEAVRSLAVDLISQKSASPGEARAKAEGGEARN